MNQASLLALLAVAPLCDTLHAFDVPRRSRITRVVALDDPGSAAPLIGCPRSGAKGLELGRAIARAIKQRFGVDAVVVPSDQIDVNDYKRRTVILLGHIVNNPEILWLYSYSYCFADAAYPGGQGYVIRQIHDPVGAGRNSLLIGASSDKGLARGVHKFIAELGELPEAIWRRPLIVDSELPIVANPPPRLDDAAVRALRDESLTRMRGGELWKEAHRIIQVARAWYMSGADAYLQQYDALTQAHREFTTGGEDQFYGGLEFWLSAYIQAWDIAEKSTFWTDSQRDDKTQLLLDLTQILVERYGRFANSPSPRMRWNHETEPALAYYFIGRYLNTYRPAPELADKYLGYARLVLGDQTRCVRGTDESGLYLPYAPSSALRYAIASRNLEMITSGRARRFGKLLLMMTDNTGRFVGTANKESRNIAYHFLLPLAAALNDATFLGPDRKTRLTVEHPAQARNDWDVQNIFGEYRPPQQPRVPDNESHVEFFPLEDALYRRTHQQPFYARVPLVKSQVPVERAFDKLVFRHGYRPDGDYLLLDGYGRGHHLRYDTMGISRFAADGRVFLIGSDDDQRVAETFQNTLTFVRDGRGHPHVPPLAELQVAVNLGQTGFSRTRIDRYSGIHWTRNILWVKDSLFVVLDQVESLTAGNYNLRCHWNGLGELSVDGNTFRLSQNERTCSVTAGAPVNISSTPDHSDAASHWSDYPHARPIIHRVRQTRSLKMASGDRCALSNLIYTHATAKPRRLRCGASTADSVAFSEDGQPRLFCVNPAAIPAPFVTDARLALLQPNLIALIRVKTFRIGDRHLLRASEPVDVELDLVAGTARFSRTARGTVRLGNSGKAQRLSEDEPTREWRLPAGLAIEIQQALQPLTSHTAAAASTATENPSPRLKVFETQVPDDLTAVLMPAPGAAADAAIVLGSRSGCRAVSLNARAELTPVWNAKTEAPVTALIRTSAPRDTARVVYGSRRGDVVALQSNGRPVWRYRLQTNEPGQRQVTCLAAADVDSDGKDEVFAGSDSWDVHALDSGGRRLWKVPAYARQITSLSLGDLTGNGQQDLLVGSSYYTLSGYDAQGQVLFGHVGEPVFQHVLVSDLDGDRQPEAVASNGSHLIVLDVQRTKLVPQTYIKGMNLPRCTGVRFQFDTGDRIRTLQVTDGNRDQKRRILVGSDSGFVYCFDQRGQLLHLRGMGDAVVALAVGRQADGRPLIAVSQQNGLVTVLDASFTPLGHGRFHGPVRWLGVRPDGILCVTRNSIGVLSGEFR